MITVKRDQFTQIVVPRFPRTEIRQNFHFVLLCTGIRGKLSFSFFCHNIVTIIRLKHETCRFAPGLSVSAYKIRKQKIAHPFQSLEFCRKKPLPLAARRRHKERVGQRRKRPRLLRFIGEVGPKRRKRYYAFSDQSAYWVAIAHNFMNM
ncbi:hypothetical protein PAECIP111802_05367 [Paenibacillus allorhizosphaerae]|uniref:Transposase DDE domain-containing protein n=1 Tax=Paenibacillus allorhizosphaerae TaxID=2849866 RepID=A0ABM8VPI7_9BACL|nr:hypothetical protein PAECIP111802_05367 [Paenibacillus allorhizosphaerae]